MPAYDGSLDILPVYLAPDEVWTPPLGTPPLFMLYDRRIDSSDLPDVLFTGHKIFVRSYAVLPSGEQPNKGGYEDDFVSYSRQHDAPKIVLTINAAIAALHDYPWHGAIGYALSITNIVPLDRL